MYRLDFSKRTVAQTFLGLIALCVVLISGADDRDLLRNATSGPMLFLTMDTSGSMHWTPGCSEDDALLDIDPWDGQCTQECTLGDTLCGQMCPDQGCVEYNFGLAGEPKEVEDVPGDQIEIIVDTEDSAGVDIVGSWFVGGIQPWKGANYLHNNRQGQGSKSIELTPTITREGLYHVYLFWSSNSDRAHNVPVVVTHKNGKDRVLLDQTVGHGDYNYVGTYELEAGTSGSVLISTENTTGYVAVDAVRFFTAVEPTPALTCQRTGYRCQQPLCPRGDCFAPLAGDDPTSKLFQAKQALYEVIERSEDVHFGLGSYEQDNVRLAAKHWSYRVDEDEEDLFWSTSDSPFPQPGAAFTFGNGPPYNTSNGQGDGWNCASNDNYRGKLNNSGDLVDPEGDAGRVGCFFSEPADNINPWELQRLQRIPKLGLYGNVVTPVWYRRNNDNDRIYRFDFIPVSGSYGDATLTVDIERRRCSSSSCSGASVSTRRVTFELISDFAAWEGDLGRPPMQGNGFFAWQANMGASNTCNGLEPNDDTDANVDSSIGFANDDTWYDYTYKWPTVEDPRGSTVEDADGDIITPRVDWFDTGDFVPFDWTKTNKETLKQRMAPNTAGGDLIADFRTATYWANSYLSSSDPGSPSNRRLRLKDEAERPLMASGSTPIAASLRDFADWYAGEDDGALVSWSGVAASRDIDWACRQKYVLFLTDGNETCGGDPCAAAKELSDLGVSTYVVGFGIPEDSASSLNCIAEKGGTEKPIFPRNKNELVDALEAILLQIKAESKSFASASIPAIQSTAADKIYLSSFIPLPGQSVWPGEIDVFRKPLPLKEGRPDVERKCVDPSDTSLVRQSACHLYEVGDLLTKRQTPTIEDLNADPPELRIGSELSDRRIIYSQENVTGKRPSELVLFQTPDRGLSGLDTTDLEDLGQMLVDEDIMAQFYEDGALPEELPLNLGLVTGDDLEAEILEVIKRTLLPRDLDSAAEPGRDQYILGDIFHANPLIVAGPSDFQYFSSDLCGKLESDAVPDNCVKGEDRGYRRFAREHVWRRRMLVSATNDGQLHFFDGGTRVEATVENGTEKVEVFTDGTGVELFSYIPRLTLPAVREQATGDRHVFSLDGEMSIRDVFIDPSDLSGGADPDEREWRTVLIAGLREGGDYYEQADNIEDFVSGYYALDLTQPDAQKQRSTDVDSGGSFNDPPQQSLLPLNASGEDGKADLPSCFDFAYDGDGHQVEPSSTAPGAGQFPCQHKFPAELWLFTDSVENGRYRLDEEANSDGTYGNGVADLGDTWSRPVIGKIALCDGTDCDPEVDGSDLTSVDVAIFGGGMDPQFKDNPQKGYWIYMVKVETGEAIYKRRVDGAVPSDPAVLDTDQDGIFDQIYVGTTNGTLYKIDLNGRDSFGDLPSLGQVDVRDRLLPSVGPGPPIYVNRIDDEGGWDPFPILQTHDNVPIFFPPSAFYIPELNTYGLALGTGDREDLWVPTSKEGRLYVIVDEFFTKDDYDNSLPSDACVDRLPIVDECLENIAWDADPPLLDGSDTEIDNSIDFLLDPFVPEEEDLTAEPLRPGYAMTFPASHRVTSQPFVASGILIYSVFQPIAFIAEDDDGTADVVCARTGITRAFVVLARNANPVARLSGVEQGEDPEIDGTVIDDPDGTGGGPIDDDGVTTGALGARDRYHKIGEFTTAPFIDRSASKTDSVGDSGTTVNSVLESEVSAAVQKAIADTFPRGSRFNTAFSLTIAALRNSTGVNVYATIPIAVYPADWKEE